MLSNHPWRYPGHSFSCTVTPGGQTEWFYERTGHWCGRTGHSFGWQNPSFSAPIPFSPCPSLWGGQTGHVITYLAIGESFPVTCIAARGACAAKRGTEERAPAIGADVQAVGTTAFGVRSRGCMNLQNDK